MAFRNRVSPKEPSDAPPSEGSTPRVPARGPLGRSLLCPSSAAARHQPRPMNGIVVAVMVRNWTFASSGSPAMKTTASAAS